MWEWNDGEYLVHHGVKEQKWGIRRFQNPDGSLTPLGREHYGIGPKRENWGKSTVKKAGDAARNVVKAIKKRKQDKVRKQNLEKARATKKANAEKKAAEERAKEELSKILKTGTAEQILANKDKYSSQELNDAYNRLKNEANLKSLLPKEKTKLDQLTEVKGKVDKVLGVVDTGINTWNKIAKISNSLFGTSMKSITDQTNTQKKEIARATKEAKKILEDYKDMALESIDQKQLAELVGKLKNLDKIEKMAR